MSTTYPNYQERHIQKLTRRIERMRVLSNRYAALRLAIIILAGASTWASASAIGSPWSWVTLGAYLLLFALVVYLHRRLDDWAEKFKLWRAIKIDHAARSRLDWELLPDAKQGSGDDQSGLEIDLDLSGSRSLHHLLDIASSQQGSQRLLDWLRGSTPDLQQIKQRQEVVQELKPLKRFRDRLRMTFHLYANEMLDGEKLSNWLKEPVPYQRLKSVLPMAVILSIANISLFALNSAGVLPPYWIISLSLYAVLYIYQSKALSTFLEAIVDLDRELSKLTPLFRYIEQARIAGYTKLAELCAPFLDKTNLPSQQLRRIKLITAGVGLRMNPIVSLLVNVVTPWDFVFATLAAGSRARMAEQLPGWLETWYELEALISLANFAALNPEYSFPEISWQTEFALQARDMGHPLLPPEEKVCNDFTLTAPGQIAIITGSNMAGKSTFIKTVGVNMCLAYAGGTVNARIFRAMPMRLHTCIRIRDSLTDGYSYFYAEVQCLKRLLEKLREQEKLPVLYLVDEIFRGTNNRERLIGSRAYLRSSAGKNGLGLLATHDLELANLAEENQQVHNFHFRDQVQAGKLVFDYKIQNGPCPTSNALRIMQMEGLPVEGQNEAK